MITEVLLAFIVGALCGAFLCFFLLRRSQRGREEERAGALDQLSLHFEHLAQRIFDEKTTRFARTSAQSIEGLVSPLARDLGEFKKKIEETYFHEAKDRLALREELRMLRGLNERLGAEAHSLATALKGQQKTQGIWGEMVLERILETSGLTKDREYTRQTTLIAADGRRLQPDVIVRLPEQKDIIVDAKVSLAAYERYCSAEDEDAGKAALDSHVQALKQHLKSLGEKGYDALTEVNSPDFVLMFIPIEGAFLAALRHDPNLFNIAYEKNVIMVSPTTLLVTLRTIHNIWRHEHQNQNAQEIARRAGDLYDKFIGFTEALADVGDKLDRARASHRLATERLATGHGNLMSRAEGIKALGVKTKKGPPRRGATDESFAP